MNAIRRTGSLAWILTFLILPGPAGAAADSGITAVWANSGEDKVARLELRASADPAAVINSFWNGAAVRLEGARNEIVAFALHLEAEGPGTEGISVSFSRLAGPSGVAIDSVPASGEGLFDWTERDIELFFVRYLEIKGLSRLSYESYDERHIPERFRRPWTGQGEGSGTWLDRPDHNAHYPDIAVPLELHQNFAIPAGTTQTVWADIYIPKDAPPGGYTGTIEVRENGTLTSSVPVELTVRDFALPDLPSARTMLFYSSENINRRYLGEPYPGPGTELYRESLRLADRHFQAAHRHRVSLIDGYISPGEMDEVWLDRLNGRLFTPDGGYRGPGEGVGNNVYSIGTYGSWPWSSGDEAAMRTNTDAWANWFAAHPLATPTEYFLYLIDESDDFPRIEEWARWMNGNPGPGRAVSSLATLSLLDGLAHTPALDIPASGSATGVTAGFQAAADSLLAAPGKKLWLYAAYRPQCGSWAIEDEGVSPRVTAWAQFKKKVQRWFVWESTYYDNFQGGTGQTDVFQSAHTFGGYSGYDPVRGATGWNYGNGDGVLFYPGTDRDFPASSYGVPGPFASLRLKHWRRGIQDVDYLTLASRIDPARTSGIVERMIPQVLWEYGVNDPGDPTWVLTDISWPTDPDLWEAARKELAEIIEGGAGSRPDSGDFDGDGTSEIAVFRPGSGLWAMRGLTRFYFGARGDRPVPGDYDGDGTARAAVFRPASGLWAVRGAGRIYFGRGGDLPVPGDYGGDGTARPGIFRPASGLWAVRGVTRTYFGSAGDLPVPGDFTGEGKKRIAVFRPAPGLWAVKGLTRVYFGGSGDSPVPGDYSGDGTWAPAIFRLETGLWAVRGSPRVYFGGAGDTPVPAAWLGDDTARIAVFRSVAGLWAVWGSPRVYFGTSGDLPVSR